jgi:phosphatidate phosphatase APP1
MREEGISWFIETGINFSVPTCMNKKGASNFNLQVYDGYGHTHSLHLYGNVYKGRPARERKYTTNIFSNIYRLVRLFFIKPVGGAKVRLNWYGSTLETATEKDGFFKFEWVSAVHLPAGWHEAALELVSPEGDILDAEKGRLFVPHITQYTFVSDIDDTVMISHSATRFKRLRELMTRHPQNRKVFDGTKKFYELLANASTDPDVPNPFFYVSSSEWNLYYDLQSFFRHNKLPQGVFLLSQMKQWFQLLSSGQTKHTGKLSRIYRILEAYPNQQYILLGDNSQADPEIYASIADRFPERIFAIYIRNIKPSHYERAKARLDSMLARETIHTMIFNHSDEAIEHAQKINLI